uniref:Uncharacterized protein n=1 Tax=Clandestinovirus TaxID=2831644 RepID=A0A8F8PR90_9VIRU|nr:hypothetical protein KOM_12_566 [Clandestinovirus]
MYQKIITTATPITEELKRDEKLFIVLQMAKRIPNYAPAYILDYTIKDGTTHFVRFSTEESDYGIEITRCIYSPDSDKVLYQTIHMSADEEEISFDISDDENYPAFYNSEDEDELSVKN